MQVKDFGEIYDWLEDDESKTLYEAMVFMRMTGKFCYLGDAMMKYCGTWHRRSLWDIVMKNKDVQTEDIVLFGAGDAGIVTYNRLMEYGIRIKCFCDNDGKKAGMWLCNVPVVHMEELMWEEGKENNTYIICNWSAQARQEMNQQLKSYGIEKYRRVFFLEFRDAQYFDNSIVKRAKDEVFVDCGGLDGWSAREFAEWTDGDYEKIYIFEPDTRNYKVCANNIKQFGLKNTLLLPYGAWDAKTRLFFTESEDFGSSHIDFIENDNTTSIDTISIDEVLHGSPATFIKMDIEGSELAALHGAAETIRRFRPKLAISIYHKPEDLLEIPLYIKELVPGYKLYLRHYSSDCIESVLYAV